MKTFTFGVRYGLVPFEQTNYGMSLKKEQWDKLRSVGVRVTGTGSLGIYIAPWHRIEGNQIFVIASDYICDWEEPTLDEWGARALRAIDYLYHDDLVIYCKEDAKVAYDYYRFSSRANAIKDVKFNGPATIVFWGDGTKTIVKAQNGEPNDPEKAIAMCIAKHFMGSNKSGSNYYDQIKKWLPKEEKK